MPAPGRPLRLPCWNGCHHVTVFIRDPDQLRHRCPAAVRVAGPAGSDLRAAGAPVRVAAQQGVPQVRRGGSRLLFPQQPAAQRHPRHPPRLRRGLRPAADARGRLSRRRHRAALGPYPRRPGGGRDRRLLGPSLDARGAAALALPRGAPRGRAHGLAGEHARPPDRHGVHPPVHPRPALRLRPRWPGGHGRHAGAHPHGHHRRDVGLLHPCQCAVALRPGRDRHRHAGLPPLAPHALRPHQPQLRADVPHPGQAVRHPAPAARPMAG